METCSVHYLNARRALDPYKDRIESALQALSRRAAQVVEPIVLDIVVRALKNGGIPETGHVGFSPGPGILMLTIDPDNPNLSDHMGEPLERMIAHELHHAIRWDSVGYGSTLGEALVSEGLAGRFAQELYGHDGEPWERAIGREALRAFAGRALARANDATYNHFFWFYGKGDLPRWLGYTLGWEMVGDFLAKNAGATPSGLTATPAHRILPSLESLAKESKASGSSSC